MQTQIFTVSWVNIKSALVTTLLMGIIAMGGYVIGVGDVFSLNTHALINSGVIAGLAGLVSLIKSWATDSSGKFVGVVTVTPPPVSPSPLNTTTVA